MKTIVAIGGYEYENEKTHEFDTPLAIDRDIVDLAGKKKAKVLFIPTASSDSVGYVEAWLKNYRDKLGCSTEVLRLISEKPTLKEIQSKLDWADVIYVGGGNTLKMMKKWRRLGVDKMLTRAYATGKILCGVSTGSICWFEYGISDSLHFYDAKETKYIKVRGLGFLKGVHNPHFGSEREDCRYRTKGMKEVMQRSKGKCFGVPDACAVIFEEKSYRVIGNPEASQVWYEKGKYQEKTLAREGMLI
jgi:dipeptidase E